MRQPIFGPVKRALVAAAAATLALAAPTASASFLQGEALDRMADIVSWFAITVVPVGLIWVFWLIHVMPEKIAEKKGHPNAPAIKVLCLLSLAFGGLLWPLAWLWAYTKPSMYKLAYGTDRVEYHTEEATEEPAPENEDDAGRAG
jgi:CBS domain containing-hemolysin-like protein